MATQTPISLRNRTIYSIFVRNHTEAGTLNAAQRDLERIRALGSDIVWLMPIHPIGVKNRKGVLGSPYAISDYRAVNPEYGTMADFKAFSARTHELGMKLIVDVVFNHTSPDSVLYAEHPDWFYHKSDGKPGNRVGDWSDIIDLDLGNADLRQYLVDTLTFWLAAGVDGFRCDVAPLLPLDFWLEARRQCDLLKSDAVWLSESVEPRFLLEMRQRSYGCLSDSEIFQAFDIAYDYDSFDVFKLYIEGKASFSEFLEVKRRQEYILADNYVKLRFCENHDQDRSLRSIPDPRAHRNWTAFTAFEKGTFLVYAGQEHADANRPYLFGKDLVRWSTDNSFEPFLKNLIALRRDTIHADGVYAIHRTGIEGVAVASYRNAAKDLSVSRFRLGIFTVEDKRGVLDLSSALPTGFSDWTGTNRIDGKPVSIKDGKIAIPAEPVIVDLLPL